MNNLYLYPVAVAAAGFVYNKISSYLDEKANPPPGELIDVGGYKLHIQRQGEARKGVPTVVVETGIFDCSQSWQLVQPEIAQFTQVVTYDRAGYGWSDPGPHPRTFDRMTHELKTLLKAKEIQPPFVFVGHSLGGAIVRHYQSQYPDDVAGIIFVDALHLQAPVMERIYMVVAKAFSYLTVFGIPRLLCKMCPLFSENKNWTAEIQKAYVACHWAKANAIQTCFDEAEAMEQNLEQLRQNKKSLRDLPITVISKDPNKPIRPGMSKEKIEKTRQELDNNNLNHMGESNLARLVIAEGSNHLVQIDRPDIVIEEIRKMVELTSTTK